MLPLLLGLLDHEEAKEEELARLSDDSLSDFKLHTLLKGRFQTVIDRDKLLLQLLHLE